MDKKILADVVDKVTQKTSVFLGAGASAALGLPTMTSFLNRAYGDDFVKNLNSGRPYHINSNNVDQVSSNEVTMATRLFQTAGLGAGKPPLDLEEIFEFVHKSGVMHSQKDIIKSLLFLFKTCHEGHGYN